MSRDPFERMRSRNPVPPATAPSAPMSMAERIMETRTAAVPTWALTAVTAAAVLVIGLGSVLLFGGGAGDGVAAGETTTTAIESTTTSTPGAAPSTTSPAVVTTEVTSPTPTGAAVAYFLVDDPSASGVSPALIPVAVPIASVPQSDVMALSSAVNALLVGPEGAGAATPAFTTAVPEGTRLLDAEIEGSVATIDLSAEFTSPAGSLGEIARLEQLLYTVTRLDGIDGMRLEIAGERVEVFGGHGIVVDDPMMRADTDTMLPAILIETPAWNGTGTDPLTATGTANVFEATVSVALTDGDGSILWEGFTTATCGTGCRGEWEVSIPYQVDRSQMGSLIVWESSARDGSRANVREHAVFLRPADETPHATTTSMVGASCSGHLVESPLVEEPGLPDPVANMRQAIFDAATACDWETLRSLQSEGFRYSFGEQIVDAVDYWQSLEDEGEEPMRYLAELLNRPFGTEPSADASVDYHVWPEAFAQEWSTVTDEERDVLRPLYGEEDFAAWDAFGGYIGYRVGIIDGAWVYFVAGD